MAAVTAKVGVKAKLPTHYYIGAESGLEQPSIVLLEQLRTIDKRRLENYIGQLSPEHIDGLNHALAVSLDLINIIHDALLMSLCPVCEQHFRNTGLYYIHHLNPQQTGKETCTYCNDRKGFDCVIIRRK